MVECANWTRESIKKNEGHNQNIILLAQSKKKKGIWRNDLLNENLVEDINTSSIITIEFEYS